MNGQAGVTPAADAAARLNSSYPQDTGYRQSTFLSGSLDNKTLNTYSDDPLSLLADVASMAPTSSAVPSTTEVCVLFILHV